MSLDVLLRAAEYLERRDREAEHGYASTLPMPEDYNRKRSKSRKSQGNRVFPSKPKGFHQIQRSSHNELEKNRRAHLRHCMERLKDAVPLGPDASRHTTLGLLTRAKMFIKGLEDGERKKVALREQLHREHRYMQRRIEALTQGQYRLRVERSISECSSSTSVSSNSASSEPSEADEVDILGSGSSDTDDHSSIRSGASDGGCAYSTRRLTLGDYL